MTKKTVDELKNAKQSIEIAIRPYLEQFEREFECKIESIGIARIESTVSDKDNYGFLVGVELNIKI